MPIQGASPDFDANSMTVRCDGEEWALEFGAELTMIDAALKKAGIDTRRLKQ